LPDFPDWPQRFEEVSVSNNIYQAITQAIVDYDACEKAAAEVSGSAQAHDAQGKPSPSKPTNEAFLIPGTTARARTHAQAVSRARAAVASAARRRVACGPSAGAPSQVTPSPQGKLATAKVMRAAANGRAQAQTKHPSTQRGLAAAAVVSASANSIASMAMHARRQPLR
jgi:hypothetical protein